MFFDHRVMAQHMLRPFHLAVPTHDLNAARSFYSMLGAREAVANDYSIIWDFFGHQVVSHLVKGYQGGPAGRNRVDSNAVPVPHFGLVLDVDAWHALRDRLQGNVDFVIEPHVRYKGTTGQQHTMFFTDPSGNALEFKAFQDDRRMFER